MILSNSANFEEDINIYLTAQYLWLDILELHIRRFPLLWWRHNFCHVQVHPLRAPNQQALHYNSETNQQGNLQI